MTDHDFEPQHKEMGHHVTTGILNAGLSQVVKIVCQFAAVVIMSRLLPPSDFGLMAMAGPIYGFIMMFQDLGLGQATIQKPTLSHEEVNTFFWINIAVGLVLTVLLVLLSPLAGWYYGEPRVTPLTAAMGVLIFLSSFGTQHGAILQRRLQFRLSALLDAGTTLLSLLVSIVAALILKNYWALYVGMAMGTIIPVIGIWSIVKWRPTAPHIVENTGEMLKFGAGVTSFNISNFFARNTDNILIGRRWGDHELGLYDRAYKLLLFPLQRVVGPVSLIMVPILSRLLGEPERYRAIFLKTMAQLTLALWPGIIWAIILADPLVPTVLGKNWSDSVPMFQPLALSGLLQVLNGAAGWLLVSQGRTGEYAKWGMFTAVTCIIAFVIGLPYGAIGVAIAYAVSECIRTPLVWLYVTRRGALKPMEVLQAVMPQAVSCCVATVVLMALKTYKDMPPIVLIVFGLVLAYGMTGATMLLFPNGRETLKQTLGIAQRLVMRVFSREGA